MTVRQFILITIFILGSVYFTFSYFTSSKFQQYGEETGAPWTCHANNIISKFYTTLSKYSRALELYETVLARCPEGRAHEEAMYQRAFCLENSGNYRAASQAYLEYAAKYPKAKRAKIAEKAAYILQTSR